MTEAAPAPEDLVRAVRAVGIRDERLLQAVRATPRAAFVPTGHQTHAYQDVPIPIGHAQVTTQPSLSAVMIEGLDLDGDEHVLEIGTGLGFQTALLARLSADVVTIEMWPDIAHQARRNLAHKGIRNVDLRVGDGSGGVPDLAPYDAIIVSAAFPEVLAPLAEQLRPGGRLVQPIGPGGRGTGPVLPAHRDGAGASADTHARTFRPPARTVRLSLLSPAGPVGPPAFPADRAPRGGPWSARRGWVAPTPTRDRQSRRPLRRRRAGAG